MDKFSKGSDSFSREAWKMSPRTVEPYKSWRGTLGQENTHRSGGFVRVGQENTLDRGERPTMVRSAIESSEPSEEKIAASLHELLKTILEHVIEKVLEAVVHSHGFGLLLKVMEFVIEFCQLAAHEDSRRHADHEVVAT